MEHEHVEHKEEVEHHHHKQENSQSQIAGAIIVAGLIIAGAILLKGSESPALNAPSANNFGGVVGFQARPVSANEHILGNPEAKIVIVEYSDTECPYCKSFHNTLQKVVKDSDGQVAWVFRHYPIPELHSKAPHEAEATECAWEQGGNDAFWKYTNKLFEVTTSNNRLDETELPKIAKDVGLNVVAFNTCLQSGKFKEKVAADVADGVKTGVRGTPSSFILVNGKFTDNIPGALPYEDVMQKIKDIK
jgi:protein-disulfide isomerase